jgi:hypothetical protein
MTDYAIPVDNLIELLKEVEDNPELFGPFGCWAQLKKPALRGLDKLRTSPKEELPRILVKFTSSNKIRGYAWAKDSARLSAILYLKHLINQGD